MGNTTQGDGYVTHRPGPLPAGQERGEDTIQAEDRVHRPGQTRECHVHYILSQGTMEEDMYTLVQAKFEAQQSVLDKKAQEQSVADLLKQAVSAQMQVARKVLERRRKAANQPASPTVTRTAHVPVAQAVVGVVEPDTTVKVQYQQIVQLTLW